MLHTQKHWDAFDEKYYEEALYEYKNMNQTTKKLLDSFLAYVLQERNNNDFYTSYGLKDRLEWVIEMEDCVSNEQVKGAMLAKGFLPICSWELNWCFKVSKVKIDPNMLSKNWGFWHRKKSL